MKQYLDISSTDFRWKFEHKLVDDSPIDSGSLDARIDIHVSHETFSELTKCIVDPVRFIGANRGRLQQCLKNDILTTLKGQQECFHL